MVMMLLASCSNNPTGGDGDPPPTLGAVNVAVITAAADYSAANFEIISTDDYTVTQNMHPGLHTDPVVRAFGKDVYILERMGKDNIIKYNSQSMRSSRAAVYNKNLGTGLNIQDIVAVSETKAYISCHNSKYLIVIKPADGTLIKKIDLSSFAPDGQEHPFASGLAVYGNHVYVACQRLDASSDFLPPADLGLIIVINTNTDEIIGSIDLEKENPQAISIFGSKMLVASAGNWFDPTTGGIELIDLSSNSNDGVITDGIFSNVIFAGANKAYAANSASWPPELAVLDLSAKTVTGIAGIADASGGMALDGAKLYVGDRGAAQAGVAVVNTSTNAVEKTISTHMPPNGLAIFKAD
jgi:YVTN family beta-propeller protein